MPRRKNPAPTYQKHKATGRARFVWTDPAGNHHDRLLPGPFNSKESRDAFARTLLECQVSPGAVARENKPESLAVVEVLSRYLGWATHHYAGRNADGKPSSALTEAKLTIRAIRTLYGDIPAAEFKPLKLQAVVAGWVAAGLSRAECNKRLGIAKKIFKWAVSQELVPPDVYHGLATVGGLQKGRTAAKETEPVGPVDDATVDATLPHLTRPLRAMVELQRLTGMRPGEATRLRMCEVDTTGEVWLYRPKKHKTDYKGRPRTVAIGPKAQAIITAFRTDNPEDYLFSPARAMKEFRSGRSAARKTPLYPSHLAHNRARRKKSPKRSPRAHYSPGTYFRAVARAAEKAGVEHWHPNQLRHTYATKVRKAHGLEAAQVLLGHSRADVTQIYAERDEALAVAVAAKMG